MKILILLLCLVFCLSCTPSLSHDKEKSIVSKNPEHNSVLRDLIRCYERKDTSGFLLNLAGAFQSVDNSGNRHSLATMTRALRDDFHILESIQFQIFVKDMRADETQNHIKASIRWDRRAFVVSLREEWTIRNQNTTLIFQKDAPYSLLSIHGDPMFGISTIQGEIWIKSGSLNGKAVTTPKRVGLVK